MNEKLQLAAYILLKGAGQITGRDYSACAGGLSEELKQIAEAAEGIVGSGGAPLGACKSVFNILNGASYDYSYEPLRLSDGGINYPISEAHDISALCVSAAAEFDEALGEFRLGAQAVNTLLQLVEDYGSYISGGGAADVSVYDGAKLSAALSLCIYERLKESGGRIGGIKRSELLSQRAFMIFSADISGIQSFIYDISSKSALFGAMKSPSRLIFSDMYMTGQCKAQLAAGINTPTEVKFENNINRLTAVANPRQIERVIRSCRFGMDIIYNAEDINKAEADIRLLCDGMKLLQFDYLGGHGSRGYGKVKFVGLSAQAVSGEDSDELDRLIGTINGELNGVCNEV